MLNCWNRDSEIEIERERETKDREVIGNKIRERGKNYNKKVRLLLLFRSYRTYCGGVSFARQRHSSFSFDILGGRVARINKISIDVILYIYTINSRLINGTRCSWSNRFNPLCKLMFILCNISIIPFSRHKSIYTWKYYDCRLCSKNTFYFVKAFRNWSGNPIKSLRGVSVFMLKIKISLNIRLIYRFQMYKYTKQIVFRCV